MTPAPRLGIVVGLACLLTPSPVPLHARDEPVRSTPAPPENDTVDDLVKALRDDNALVRKRAAIALGRLGPGARAAVPALEKALRDADADVRAAAAASLEKVDVRPSLEALVERLHDRKAPEQGRRDACKELAERFWQEPKAARALEEVLTDPAVKVAAAGALDEIDRRAGHQPARPEAHTVLLKGLPNLLLRRREGKPGWERLAPENGAPDAEDTLLAPPGYRGQVQLPGGVGLLLWGNVPELLELPLLESAVRLHAAAGTDLDFTLERGRVLVSNRKEAGPARVRVHFGGTGTKPAETWDLTLEEPGTEVALDLFGRYPRGAGFRLEGGDPPLAELYLLVLQGTARVKADASTYTLRAPGQGPSLMTWDNSGKGAQAPTQASPALQRYFDKGLPQTQVAGEVRTALTELLKRPFDRPVELILEESLQADRPHSRAVGVYCLGAVGAIPYVVDALAEDDARRGELRDAAVLTLRHWLGARADHGRRLYETLVREKHYTRSQAETVLQLLHDFPEEQLTEPQTWEALLGYLRAGKPAIRTLAYWHLYRLVPQGRDPKYNPAGDTKQRETAYQAWKTLIPDGKLPPTPGKQPPKSK